MKAKSFGDGEEAVFELDGLLAVGGEDGISRDQCLLIIHKLFFRNNIIENQHVRPLIVATPLHPEGRPTLAYVELASEEQWNAIAATKIDHQWWCHIKGVMPSNDDNSPVSR